MRGTSIVEEDDNPIEHNVEKYDESIAYSYQPEEEEMRSTDSAEFKLVDEKIERIYDRLIAHIDSERGYCQALELKIEKQDELIKQVASEVAAINKLVERYKGAFGLLALVGSALVSGALIFKEFILAHLR